MKSTFKNKILAMSENSFQKLKFDLAIFTGNVSRSALVAWAVDQIDLRKNKNGMTPMEILIEINKIR
jgi:hypothetical protein